MPVYLCDRNAMRWIYGELNLDWVVICDYRKGRVQCHGCKFGVELNSSPTDSDE